MTTIDLSTIDALLEQEERRDPPATLAERMARRQQIHQALHDISVQVRVITSRYARLEKLPPLSIVQEAQALLDMPNLVFVVLDTTGVHEQSDILRMCVVDRQGSIVFDRIVKPKRLQFANTEYTGILQEQVDLAPSISVVWQEFRRAVAAHFVLSYNLPFVQSKLSENAEYYGLEAIHLVGDCLQEKAELYFQGDYPRAPKLTLATRRIGHPLSEPTLAPERAQGQLALLKAMSQGITTVVSSSTEDKQ